MCEKKIVPHQPEASPHVTGAYADLVRTEFGDVRSREQNFIGQKLENRWTNLNRYISISTDIDKNWFVIFEHTMNYLFYGCVHLSQLEYFFSFPPIIYF